MLLCESLHTKEIFFFSFNWKCSKKCTMNILVHSFNRIFLPILTLILIEISGSRDGKSICSALTHRPKSNMQLLWPTHLNQKEFIITKTKCVGNIKFRHY